LSSRLSAWPDTASRKLCSGRTSRNFSTLAGKPAGLNVTMEQLQVPPGSKLVSRRLDDLVRREGGVIVLAVRKPDGRMISGGNAGIGWRCFDLMGEQPGLRNLETALSEAGVRP